MHYRLIIFLLCLATSLSSCMETELPRLSFKRLVPPFIEKYASVLSQEQSRHLKQTIIAEITTIKNCFNENDSCFSECLQHYNATTHEHYEKLQKIDPLLAQDYRILKTICLKELHSKQRFILDELTTPHKIVAHRLTDACSKFTFVVSCLGACGFVALNMEEIQPDDELSIWYKLPIVVVTSLGLLCTGLLKTRSAIRTTQEMLEDATIQQKRENLRLILEITENETLEIV